MKRFIGLSLFCLFSSVVLVNMVSFAQEEDGKQTINPFADRIITVYLNGPTLENGQILEDAEIKEIGGRKMIVGMGTDTGDENNWTTGVEVGIAWDSVAVYYSMTKEQYKKQTHKQR